MKDTGRHDDLSQMIGGTPLIKLRSLSKLYGCEVYCKYEGFNPGHSTKDRIVKFMLEKAEKEGVLKKGDTVIEATSGNTGFSLAMLCAIKGYHCVLFVKDKASKDKIGMLKAMGADVRLCPAAVDPEDPRSYYSQAKALASELPNSYYLNQNYNTNNAEAHYNSTGPEIWRQTEGKITHLVSVLSTGGTISGTAKFLKEQKPEVKVIAADSNGSALTEYFETGKKPEENRHKTYLEGVGKNIIPANVYFDKIDQFVQVDDERSAYCVRKLAVTEGILAGYSSGASLDGLHHISDQLDKNSFVVLLFHDHGSRYLSKVFNDEWMEEVGFDQEDEKSDWNGNAILTDVLK